MLHLLKLDPPRPLPAPHPKTLGIHPLSLSGWILLGFHCAVIKIVKEMQIMWMASRLPNDLRFALVFLLHP